MIQGHTNAIAGGFGILRRFPRRFLLLDGAIRELWIVFSMKLLGTTAYSIMSTTLVLWLSSDLGRDDEHAGYWAAAWSTTMTLMTVLVGSFTDAMGIRKALLFGVSVCVASRFIMTASTLPWLVLGLGLMPLAFGEALGTPVLVAATRRYSTTAQRSFAFSISYSVMNVGFYLAAVIFDSVRGHLGEHGHITLPGTAIQLSTYRTLFLISFAFELLQLPILFFGIREGAEATDDVVLSGDSTRPVAQTSPNGHGEPRTASGELSSSHGSTIRGIERAIVGTLRNAVRVFAGLWRQAVFYKFMGVLAFAALVRLVFVHLVYTDPKFAIRELGQDAPVAKLSGINSLLIIPLVPVVGALTRKVSAYRMVRIGSIVAAASVYVMAMPPQWFARVANGWLGHFVAHWYLRLGGAVNPWYVIIFIFVVLLSIGESIYSPRLYEYAAAIAPKGQEGSYMALSYLPFFLAKLCVTSFSGALLHAYCPESGERHSSTLWLIIALTTSIAPIGLIGLRRRLQVCEAGREVGA